VYTLWICIQCIKCAFNCVGYQLCPLQLSVRQWGSLYVADESEKNGRKTMLFQCFIIVFLWWQLEEIMEKETYKKAKEILEKFSAVCSFFALLFVLVTFSLVIIIIYYAEYSAINSCWFVFFWLTHSDCPLTIAFLGQVVRRMCMAPGY